MFQGLSRYFVFFVFAVALMVNSYVWYLARNERAEWGNVPPVPSLYGAEMMALGDRQLAYRTTGIMLQNLGDSGGRAVNLRLYDYKALGQWFKLGHQLDPQSGYMPLLAAFYFSSTPNGADLAPVIDYLTIVGQQAGQERWRWLAQAVFLARYRMGDLDLALDLADMLAHHPDADRPTWSYEMPAFILNARGEKNAAFDLLIGLLKDRADKLDPNEVNFTYDYICRELLEGREELRNQLCNMP